MNRFLLIHKLGGGELSLIQQRCEQHRISNEYLLSWDLMLEDEKRIKFNLKMADNPPAGWNLIREHSFYEDMLKNDREQLKSYIRMAGGRTSRLSIPSTATAFSEWK